jgi:hypothetical protein
MLQCQFKNESICAYGNIADGPRIPLPIPLPPPFAAKIPLPVPRRFFTQDTDLKYFSMSKGRFLDSPTEFFPAVRERRQGRLCRD